VPNGYIGWIFIVYDQKEFPSIEEGNCRMYRIPQSGLLFTAHQANWGVVRSSKNDIKVYYIDDEYNLQRRLPVYVQVSKYFNEIYQDSVVAFPLPPHGKGKYSIYPLYIDTLKNIYKYYHASIPIEEGTIDSMLNNR
jgi:hypothetical protein